MSYNTFTKFLAVTDGPWRTQDPQRGIIVDQQDRRIATVAKAGALPCDERAANVACIAAAPELLGALRAAAYALSTVGFRLTDEYLELIDRASAGAPRLLQDPDVEVSSIAIEDNSIRDNLAGPHAAVLPQVPDPD